MGRTRQGPEAAGPETLLEIDEVADLLKCSDRHIRRLCTNGRMPAPIRVGALVRWRRDDILGWIEQGCPPAEQGTDR